MQKIPSTMYSTLSLASLITITTITIIFSTTISAQSTTISSDISALKAIKSAIKTTTIPSYSCLASWNFSSDPCSSPHYTHFICGLTCYSNRVTQLTFDPAGYSGTLSPLISKLTQLVTIDLSDNYFSGPIPSSLSSLYNLQTLNLRTNSFSGLIPPSISNLKSLQSLDLSHNSLTGFLPNNLNSLTGLRRLDLSFNKLAGSLPKLPPNLVELAVKANSLTGSLYKLSFDGLTQLEVVELSENSLTGTIPGWFFLSPALQQVNLANNEFTRVEIWKPANNHENNLVAVDLGFNRIEGFVPINFSDYPLLSAISLSHNKLRGPIPAQYSKKETLKRLFLDGNYLNGSPPVEFFAGGGSISGSLGDNCLQRCPVSSQLCVKSQKPSSICQQAYGGKPKS